MFIFLSFSPLGEKCAYITNTISYASSKHAQSLRCKIWLHYYSWFVFSQPFAAKSSVEEEQLRTPVLGVDECAKRASIPTVRQAWLGYMSLQMSKWKQHTEISEVAQGHAAANAELKLESAFFISSPVPFPLYTIS